MVRITLIVYMPEPKGAVPEDKDGQPRRRGRPSIKLVTYVDPYILFDAEVEDPNEPLPEENP